MTLLVAVTGRSLPHGRVTNWRHGAVAVPKPYIDSLARAGAVGVIVPPGRAPDLMQFNGLLLTGGGDIAPERYGQTPLPEVYGVDAESDAVELDLARQALDLDWPVLAICRGLQVLNVALGGTLDQHIAGRTGLIDHGTPGTGTALHPVTMAPDSLGAKAMGTDRPMCSSHHHQVADRLGDGVVATGWSDDGLIEALEVPDSEWMVAVQWHPEDTAATDPAQQGLFDAFVAAMGE